MAKVCTPDITLKDGKKYYLELKADNGEYNTHFTFDVGYVNRSNQVETDGHTIKYVEGEFNKEYDPGLYINIKPTETIRTNSERIYNELINKAIVSKDKISLVQYCEEVGVPSYECIPSTPFADSNNFFFKRELSDGKIQYYTFNVFTCTPDRFSFIGSSYGDTVYKYTIGGPKESFSNGVYFDHPLTTKKHETNNKYLYNLLVEHNYTEDIKYIPHCNDKPATKQPTDLSKIKDGNAYFLEWYDPTKKKYYLYTFGRGISFNSYRQTYSLEGINNEYIDGEINKTTSGVQIDNFTNRTNLRTNSTYLRDFLRKKGYILPSDIKLEDKLLPTLNDGLPRPTRKYKYLVCGLTSNDRYGDLQSNSMFFYYFDTYKVDESSSSSGRLRYIIPTGELEYYETYMKRGECYPFIRRYDTYRFAWQFENPTWYSSKHFKDEGLRGSNYDYWHYAPDMSYLEFAKKYTMGCEYIEEIQPPPPSNGGGGRPPHVGGTHDHYNLKLFIDKVTMGTVTLCKPQLEVGTIATDWKPNPNDIDGGLREEVKIITDKVAKLEVKTGEIDALVKDNTTKITTLKDDTTKKITEIDNNIANIKVESGAIKTQVTKLEEKTTELDGQVQETAKGLNEVKQTVTPDAIINTVQSTITQAKQDAVAQAGADTDQKLQEYTLKDDFTSFTQDSKKFELAVKSAGVTNLLKNSRPRNHNLDYWYIGYNYHTMYIYYGGTDEATATENYNGEVFRSGIWFTMYSPTVPEGWLFLANNSIREYKFNTERDYTIDFLLYSEEPVSFYIQIANDNGAHQLFYSGNLTHEGGGYKRFTHTFRPTEQGDAPNFMLVVNNRRGERVNWFLPWANLYEGHKVTEQHLPDGRGLIDSRTTIDGNGIKCTFEDGTYAKMGREGFLYCTPHMNTPYKYINFTTRITGVRNGHWVEVQLPTIFRDKQININFIVQAWPGAVDSDAFSKFTQDALRNLFIEVGRWDPARHVLLVRPCMQKIGLKTLNMYGWDSATTTPGRPIGEGKVDIILLAQM